MFSHEDNLNQIKYYLSTYLSSRKSGCSHSETISLLAKSLKAPSNEAMVEYGINCIKEIFKKKPSTPAKKEEAVFQKIRSQMIENEFMLLQLSSLVQLTNYDELTNQSDSDLFEQHLSSIEENESFYEAMELGNPYVLLAYSNLLESIYEKSSSENKQYFGESFSNLEASSRRINNDFGIFGHYVAARIHSLFGRFLLDKVKYNISPNRLFSIKSSSESLSDADNELRKIGKDLSQMSLIDQIMILDKIDNNQDKVKEKMELLANIVQEEQSYCTKTI